MKKAKRQHQASDNVTEYDARVGVRGKYADAYAKAFPGAAHAETLHIWAPLASFVWSGSKRTIFEDMRVALPEEFYSLGERREFKYSLSEAEWDRCRTLRHWLHFTHSRSEPVSAKTRMNAFLLSLWIARPTRTSIPLRFDISESGQVRTVSRVLERFQWVEGHVNQNVRHGDLVRVGALIKPVLQIAGSRGRLKNALALTFRGCVASEWQSAVVCFAAATEAMLSYSSAPGITKRLARAYAQIVSTGRTVSEDQAEHFARLYRLRSDVVHGRAYDRTNQAENLEALASFADAIRHLWSSVLQAPNILASLEGADEQRAALFDATETISPDSSVIHRRWIGPGD